MRLGCFRGWLVGRDAEGDVIQGVLAFVKVVFGVGGLGLLGDEFALDIEALGLLGEEFACLG